LSRPDTTSNGLHHRAVESGLFESGRPILLSPPSPPKQIATNVLIAWNDSTEQTRVTEFPRNGKPRVSISETVHRYENRLRTTLTHEYGLRNRANSSEADRGRNCGARSFIGGFRTTARVPVAHIVMGRHPKPFTIGDMRIATRSPRRPA
jgi:hypothetical protein